MRKFMKLLSLNDEYDEYEYTILRENHLFKQHI